jgi:hypothetical protein
MGAQMIVVLAMKKWECIRIFNKMYKETSEDKKFKKNKTTGYKQQVILFSIL